MSQPAEIRGYSAKQSSREARATSRYLAWLIDLSLAVMACLLLLEITHASPVPKKRWVLYVAAAFAVFGPALRYLTQATLGERAWSLTSVEGKLKSHSSEPEKAALVGGFLTLASVTAAILSVNYVTSKSPVLSRAEVERLQPFLPVTDKSWEINSFYYTLGAWPKTYLGKPVFYSVPYEKGPPIQFIPELVAHWETGVRVKLEGPRTPLSLASGFRTRAELRDCLTSEAFAGGKLGIFACLNLRSKVLERHLAEMQSFGPLSWRIRWFVVENPAIPTEEQAQGIHLEAVGRRFAQSRYILITARGTNETISASYPATGEDSVHARDTVEKVVSSLRVSDDLGPGRAWVDSQIEHVKLDQIQKINDPKALADRLSEIEATLLSKITVEPKSYDAYFHLGGVAMMIAREGARQKEPEWQASAGMLDSLYRYAKDIAPQDPRTTQLESLLVESKKF
jgi:hypothetical protein